MVAPSLVQPHPVTSLTMIFAQELHCLSFQCRLLGDRLGHPIGSWVIWWPRGLLLCNRIKKAVQPMFWGFPTAFWHGSQPCEGLTLSFPFVTTTSTTKTWPTESGVIDVDEAQVFSHSNPRPKHPLVWREIFGTVYRRSMQLPPRTYPALPSILI